MTTIHTDRLIIRDHIAEDLNNLHKLISNNEVMFYLPEIMTKTLEESNKNLSEAIHESKNTNRTKYFFAIYSLNYEKYIGEIGFTKVKECNQGNIMNLGYFINKECWGKGYVTEAAKAIIDFAFKELNTVKIETGCIKDNKNSEKVMIKLGLKKEAELEKHSILNNVFHDRLEYGITREAWIKLQNNKKLYP